MILTLIVLVVVVALAAFLATQGALTALLTFFSAIFAAILAMGLIPVLTPLAGAWKPELGMSLSYLSVFVIAFGALRLGTDMLIPGDIHLPNLIARIAGGAIGLLASTTVVGALLIGIFMLPISENILGSGGFDDDGNVSMPFPVSFTGGMLKLANGGAQGGTSLAAVYPDLPAALAGYRHTVQSGNRIALGANQVEVRGWYVPDAATLKDKNITTDAGVPTIVRTTILNNSDSGAAADADNYFRLTPQQVRLIAKSGGSYRQFTPIGYLDKGTTFTKITDKDVNQAMVDDVNEQGQIIHDWVFAITDGFIPVNIEIKQGGLVSLDGKQQTAALEALAAAKYPPRRYMKDQATVQVAVKAEGGVLAKAKVWVLLPAVTRRNVDIVREAYDAALNKESSFPGESSPGTIPGGDFRAVSRELLDVTNSGPTERINWSKILVNIVKSRLEMDGRRNVSVVLPNFMDNKMRDIFASSGTQVGEILLTDNDGLTPKQQLAPGSYTFVCYASTADSFLFWVIDKQIEPRKEIQIDMNSPSFALSMNKK